MILQPRVSCMSGSALQYWYACRTTSLENTDWLISQIACACIPYMDLQAVNQSDMPLWHPSPTNQDPLSLLRHIVRVCTPGCEFLGAEAAQEPGGRGMSVGVISMLLGPAELSEFRLIYVRDSFKAWSEGYRGSRREGCRKGLSLWGCCDVVGIVSERSSIDPFIVLHIVLRVRRSRCAVLLHCESAQADVLWIDKCW